MLPHKDPEHFPPNVTQEISRSDIDDLGEEFYHRIRPLWQKAKTPESDSVDQFLTTMNPGLSTSLLSKSYDRVRDLLDEVRVVEDRKKDVSHGLNQRHPASCQPLPRNHRLNELNEIHIAEIFYPNEPESLQPPTDTRSVSPSPKASAEVEALPEPSDAQMQSIQRMTYHVPIVDKPILTELVKTQFVLLRQRRILRKLLF